MDVLNRINVAGDHKNGDMMNRIAIRRNIVESKLDNSNFDANRDNSRFGNSVKKNNFERIFPEGDGLPWKDFDGVGYIDVKRVAPGGDKYRRNKFNQEASDNMPVDRNVPDTRNDK